MATKTDILGELNFITDRLSTQVRTTAFGALVFAWGLLVGDSPVARSVAGQYGVHLIIVGGMAILTMFLDFIQYFAGYVNVRSLYRRMEAADRNEGQYDQSSFSFRVRFYLFYVKIASLTLTIVWLLYVLGHWLITSYG